MVQTDELLRTMKKLTYLISSTSREKEDFQRRLFLLTKRSSHFCGKFIIFSESPLISDCNEIVETSELQKTKKKETYLTSPTSREIEDF